MAEAEEMVQHALRIAPMDTEEDEEEVRDNTWTTRGPSRFCHGTNLTI